MLIDFKTNALNKYGFLINELIIIQQKNPGV
jgi:hypothetical protein